MTLLHLEEPRALEKAIAILQHGGLVAFPTDTVYGIGASLSHVDALDRIYESKARDRERTLPVLLGSIDDLQLVSHDVDPDLLRLASHFWPGPLTVAVPAIPGKLPPQVVAPDGTVGVRVPNHSVALVLAQRCGGAMAVTSANVSGQPPATHPEDIDPALAARLDLVLDGGIARGGLASTVIGLRDATITLIREGAIPAGELEAVWSQVRSTSNGGIDEGRVPAPTS
jgi:L-threonylcarbamoyladenylate synthase